MRLRRDKEKKKAKTRRFAIGAEGFRTGPTVAVIEMSSRRDVEEIGRTMGVETWSG